MNFKMSVSICGFLFIMKNKKRKRKCQFYRSNYSIKKNPIKQTFAKTQSKKKKN